MKTEIETRFLEIDKEKMINMLKSIGAIDKGEIMMNEIIFYDKDLKSLENNTFCRLRKKGDKITLTYKSNAHQQTDSAKEIEFQVLDFKEPKLFLEAMGMIAYRTVEKYRHTFELNGTTLDIDTWPKIPTYIELEGDSIEILKSIAQKLDLNWDDRFDGDARFVYKKYGFDFDNIRTVTFDKFE
jgi:adenylate cyclase class 2